MRKSGRKRVKTTSSVLIRRGQRTEAALISDIARRAKGYWGYDESFMALASEELTLTETDLERLDLQVAVNDERIVAFYAIDGEPPEGELAHFFVDPDWIGTGLGGTLLAHAVDRARSAGFHLLLVESDPNAEGFYLHHGAKEFSARISPSTGRALPLLKMQLTEA